MDSIRQTRAATNRDNLFLLIQLRWIAVAGQIATIAVVHVGLGIDLPLDAMGSVIAALVAVNVFSLWWRLSREQVSNLALFLELLADVAALTVQIFLSGGASNPFISLYLLQVILGTVLLDAWSAWTIVGISSLCFVGMTMHYRPILLPHRHGAGLFDLHIQGMFIGFVLASGLLVVFVTRIQRNLRARDAHLAALRQQSAEEDHIVRMGLLASGAAHELGTPLATLSVILSDWQRMASLRADPEMVTDMREMNEQLSRCKAIVSGILVSSGHARGEGTVRTTVSAFLAEAVRSWRETRSPTTLESEIRIDPDLAIVSDTALRQVLFNVLDNALEASPAIVRIVAERGGETLTITVEDDGPGFEPDILHAFGRPYHSTKNRPGGGLGLFLVVNVIRNLGGTVTASNRAGGGARVVLTLPIAALALEEDHGV